MADNTSLSGYIKNSKFGEDLQSFRKYINRKTGFSNWDKYTSLYPGLYVLGAITSLGKTTFCLQLAEQLAEQGETVIYYSLEQTKLEMATKCLSRNLYKEFKIQASAINIRRGFLDNGKPITDEIDSVMGLYEKKVGNRLYIIECAFDTTIEAICNHVGEVEKTTGRKPVVFLDYLQILGTERTDLNSQAKVDYIVKQLKNTQKTNDLVFFVISSLNRQNYLTPIDYEAFKESGGIEYTADVILGLQLQVLHEDIFNKDGKLKEKRERVKVAKRENPRKEELVTLKNRYGIANYTIGFNYYPACDLFVPENDFIDLDLINEKSPFDNK